MTHFNNMSSQSSNNNGSSNDDDNNSSSKSSAIIMKNRAPIEAPALVPTTTNDVISCTVLSDVPGSSFTTCTDVGENIDNRNSTTVGEERDKTSCNSLLLPKEIERNSLHEDNCHIARGEGFVHSNTTNSQILVPQHLDYFTLSATTTSGKSEQPFTNNMVENVNTHLNNQEFNSFNSNLKEDDHDVSSIDSRTVDIDDSGSQGSSTSSNPFADPPSLADVADDLSELSELELNFEGPIDWPDGDLISNQPELTNQALRSGAPLQLDSAAAKLLLYQGDNSDLKTVDPRTQARLEALLEAAGIGKLSTTDGKAFADPEVLRKLTSSVSCALDEAAASLTRMRAENQTTDLQSSRTLAEACSDGDIEAVKRLLNEGRSVHETNDEGESLLSLACSAGYYELADVLLRMRANVEDRGRKGDCTPLMEASSSGYSDITRLLISYQADVNAQSSAGHTALHHAAVGGHESVVQLLIDAGANVEQQNENGHTPLMESASAGHVGVAKILLSAGAGINTHSNEFKESALTLACYKGHLDMVKFLLDAGADQEHKTDEMHTALMEASMDGHVEVARLLLDSGAQVNMPIDSFESPLTLAACGGHVELAGLLLERGAKMEEVNDEGYTALMEASREGHEDMVGLLITHGAQVNTQTDETQETALTLACCGGFMEVARTLIGNSADIELGCSTPLMEASQEGHLDLVNYLITNGSDVHALTATNDTALTYACENGHTDVADVLLGAGARLENESEGGRTPLMKAARAGHLCTVQFLISKGADVNRCTSNNEHTVLSLACAGGHLGVVEILLGHGADPMHKLKDGSTMLIEAAKGGHTNVVNLLLDYPNGTHKSAVTVSSEYPDSIPMADDLPADATNPKDLSLKSTESLASRLEQFIHKMMSQADNSSGTREEQMARKQEILEELQRVEQELKLRTQIAQQESSQRSLDDQSLVSLSAFPPSMTPSHEFVEQELQQKQLAIVEQQKHEAQLQQQKEYYQAKLQHLKQQYQEKQLQLQQQRQQLLSQAASNGSSATPAETNEESSRRQPIPLHIALQNHLHAHHVTEGNVNDLAQALQEWDTRDRSINLPHSQVKPMPAFNLSTKAEDSIAPEPTVSDLSLRMEDLTFNEAPPSRSLAHSLATLIQNMDSSKTSNFDPALEKVIDSTSSLERPSGEYEMTFKTLEWLKMVDESCGNDETPETKKPLPLSTGLLNKPVSKSGSIESPGQDKPTNTTKITKVLNGYVEPMLPPAETFSPATVRTAAPPPNPQRSSSPLRLPFVDPNAETDSNHDTALTLACAGGHSELVKLLLSREAEIEHRDKKGFTPLILASTAGHSEVVEILIEHGADIEAQSERTKDTPLSLACSGGRYEVVEILLRLGANKEHRNVSDYTPLSLAASGGYVNIIKLLLSYGAEINSRTGSKLGISPLMLAAMNGHTAAVKLLLDMGSDINAQIETNRNTALTLACFQGRHDVVSLLVDRKANIEHRAKTGLTPLMEAASGGYVEVGRVLLDKSADVNAPPVPSSKDTALTIAADKGHYRFVDLLLKRGASVDVKNKKGNSPLWLACNGGHLDVVQLLVANKADIDSQDNRRVSSLMTAFRKGHIKVVKWLVKHVTQFPSDQECARFIATVNDKEMLKKCQQCMGIIVQAKEQQAREALKNASSLLEQIETEKSREEKRKEAAARKREKKKQKRKEKLAEHQADKLSPEPEKGKSDRCTTPEEPVSISPPSPPPELLKVELPKNVGQSVQQKNCANSKSRVNKDDDTSVNSIETGEGDMVHTIGKENLSSKRNRRNKEKGQRSESQNVDKKTLNREPAKAVKTSSRITELDDFGEALTIPNGNKSRHSKRLASSVSQLDSFDCSYTSKSPMKSTPTKAGISPSPGKKKREEGGSDWKQVTNKKSSKRVSIPSRSAHPLNKSLNSIKDKSGAHLEFDKADKKSGEKTLIIRGSAEAVRNAHTLVSSVLKDAPSETSNQSSKKSATGVASSGTSSQANARDTLSNVGMFKISDYIASTQTTTSADTKMKTQSRPSWVVRPSPPVSQSAWGVHSGEHLTASTTQASAPAASKPAQNRIPTTQPSPAKQPVDVSRQLFLDARTSISPSLVPAENKQRVAAAPAEAVERPPSAGHSPISSQIVVQPQVSGQPGFAGPPYMTPSIPNPLVTKAVPPANPSQIGPPAGYYSFEGQPSHHMAPLDRVSQEANRNLVHPNKAPGFRSAQPQSVYLADASGFSRAPGSRVNAMYSGDQLMPSLSSSLMHPGMDGDPHPVMGVNMPFGDLRKAPPLLLRDQYTTRDQPMTLPHISSSLNPNASEFAAPPRFTASNGAQHSPRSNLGHHQRASPVDMRPSTPGFQPQVRSKTTEQEYYRAMMQLSSASSVSPSVMSAPKIAGSGLPNQPAFPPSSTQLLLSAANAVGAQNHSSVSPPADGGERGPVKPIGVERYFLGPTMNIWGNTKGNDGEWGMKMPQPMSTTPGQSPIPSADPGQGEEVYPSYYEVGAGDANHMPKWSDPMSEPWSWTNKQ